MPNPIFTNFQNVSNPGPFGNLQNLMSQFNQFRQNFQGDARAQVEQLLSSGKMSQEQFNQLSNLANQFQSMMGR